jgi:DNA-binding LacI/PurR family transcriptional regulator
METRNTLEVPERKSGLYGIIFPSLGANYVFDIICSEITRVLAQHDCSLVWGGVVVPSSIRLMDDIEQICAKYIELRVDGVFLAPIEYTPLRDSVNSYIEQVFATANIPLVLIDSDLYEFPKRSVYDLVSLDHVEAGYMITAHMIESHARNIHFLSPPMSAHAVKLRQMGYREALYDADIPLRHERIHVGDPSDTECVSRILVFEPQAILCSNDGTAIKLQETLRRCGMRVPHDIAVAGFDNLSYLAQIRVPLTSVSQPTDRISREAVRLMLERKANRNRPARTVRLSGHLVVRKSTSFGEF